MNKKRLLLTIPLLALTLTSCDFSEIFNKDNPKDIDSLKDALVYMNKHTNYSFSSTFNGDESTYYYFLDNSYGKVNYSNLDSSLGYIKEKDGVYRVTYRNEQYYGSEYLLDSNDELITDIYSSGLVNSLYGVGTDYINSLSSSNEITLTNKAYKLGIAKAFDFTSDQYLKITEMKAKYEEGCVTFTIVNNKGTYEYSSMDIGSTYNPIASSYKGGHLVLNQDLDMMKKGLLCDRFTRDVYDVNEKGYVGVEVFHPHYFFSKYNSSDTIYFYIEMPNADESHDKGIFYGTLEKLSISSLVRVNAEPSIEDYFHYPNLLKMLDYLEYLSPIDKSMDSTYTPTGNLYSIYEDDLVVDFAKNFSFDQTWSLSEYYPEGMEVDIVGSDSMEDMIVMFLYYFRFEGQLIRVNVPLTQFGTVKNTTLDGLYDQYSGE